MKTLMRPAMWNSIGTRFLPFADAASADLPLSRILRLSLFQVSVGISAVLLTGTLNRVMIVELKMSAALVAAMVSLPLLFAPLRALIGHKSDTHRSVLGWRRVPYIWFGTMAQFAGFAILPFALLVMSGAGAVPGSQVVGQIAAALGFLLVGAGMHTTQTAGLALATDLASKDKAPRVVALLYVMLLTGMMVSALVIGRVLADFTATRLVQVVQGVALLTVVLNVTALWKQEARNAPRADTVTQDFSRVWAAFVGQRSARRLLTATGLGAAAFAMQDVLLEPYAGQVLGLSVGATTSLTALWALGTLLGFAYAARSLSAGSDAHKIAGNGGVAGIAAFLMIIFSGPNESAAMLCVGAGVMGLGGGLFAVGTLTAAMALSQDGRAGLAVGAWGAVQATCTGAAILLGGLLRDALMHADLGPVLGGPGTGYAAVYLVEILLLLAMLVAVGPLVGRARRETGITPKPFGLTEFPT